MGLRGMCGRGLRPLAAAKQLAKDWTCQQIELCCWSFSFCLLPFLGRCNCYWNEFSHLKLNLLAFCAVNKTIYLGAVDYEWLMGTQSEIFLQNRKIFVFDRITKNVLTNIVIHINFYWNTFVFGTLNIKDFLKFKLFFHIFQGIRKPLHIRLKPINSKFKWMFYIFSKPISIYFFCV